MAHCVEIEAVWICPPLAFARFGRSPFPLENFHWAPNDYAPRGTAETVVRPAPTFRIDDNGNLSAYMPETLTFRDGEDWRPVCPFFELHGRLSDGYEGPLGLVELERLGLSLADVRWEIRAGNRKAYHYTLAPGDDVQARVEIGGDDHRRRELRGSSPPDAVDPLVPASAWISFGAAQVVRPGGAYPELRCRITPPKGLIYAPTNLPERDLGALLEPNADREAFLSQVHCVLNPASGWAVWEEGVDPRTNPGGLYAQDQKGVSLGFLDDSCDGLVSATLRGASVRGGTLRAHARFTCCPPDFQPDRRPFVSVSDGLKDLTDRAEVLDPEFISKQWPETEREIADQMQRVRETMEASNLDHQNLRSLLGNLPFGQPPFDLPGQPAYPFTPVAPTPGHPLPLTELGRAQHARFLAYQVFKQHLGNRPELFERWIRDPTAEPAPYDRKMPAVMRGSDAMPMHLTQRQFELMRGWLAEVQRREDTTQGGPT